MFDSRGVVYTRGLVSGLLWMDFSSRVKRRVHISFDILMFLGKGSVSLNGGRDNFLSSTGRERTDWNEKKQETGVSSGEVSREHRVQWHRSCSVRQR